MCAATPPTMISQAKGGGDVKGDVVVDYLDLARLKHELLGEGTGAHPVAPK
ncbi:MAG: hypothetical protein AAF416_17280 [Pseudomonadota bacterium]